MAQGQAAGTGAAMAVANGISPRDINIRELQTTLLDQGVQLRENLADPDPDVIERIGQLPKEDVATTGDMDAASRGEFAWKRSATDAQYDLLAGAPSTGAGQY